ncbi:hypothetical protein NAPIS_ORF01394 [Vairimorpha apis BRL 01]|uniref:Uncharacterized protein n=1 Tax=Vairimorpha apis BRL 01 TaxID=1037528 RepID=T0L0H9_9MICR|nr:hypothetical protein NAPIS_ORF01394 [Vairimorpha apis BRL 01]
MGVKTEQTGENKTKHLKTVEATIDDNVGMIEEDGNKKDNNSSFSTSETLDSILTKYKLDNNKRRKTETVEKECSLLNGKILLDTLNVFKEKLAILNKTSVEKIERTRKIPLLKVDSIKLDATIKAVQDHVSKHPPHSMSEIARILQAAQICYQETTRKDAKPSKWVESIKCKISLLESKVKLLEKVRAFGKLSAEEKRDAKKYMREVNMLACLHQDTLKL